MPESRIILLEKINSNFEADIDLGVQKLGKCAKLAPPSSYFPPGHAQHPDNRDIPGYLFNLELDPPRQPPHIKKSVPYCKHCAFVAKYVPKDPRSPIVAQIVGDVHQIRNKTEYELSLRPVRPGSHPSWWNPQQK